MNYLKKDLRVNTISLMRDRNQPSLCSEVGNDKDEKSIFKDLNKAYVSLMKKSFILTNSEFTRRAIKRAFRITGVHIMSPPVEVKIFSKNVRWSKQRT